MDSSTSKRQRSSDSSQKGSFESELAKFDGADTGGQTSGGCASLKWPRPPVPSGFDPVKDIIEFQQLEVDHYIGEKIYGFTALTDLFYSLFAYNKSN